MRPFAYERATDAAAAVQAAKAAGQEPPTRAETQFLAGGTTLVDLMKLNVMQPARVIDLNGLETRKNNVRTDQNGLFLSAFARMADVADHPVVRRDYPVLAQSLDLAASAQLRNMATLGGNVLQRTRCTYFRDTSWAACNKRNPGSGCAARDGVNRRHAILGTSDACIATYPGDFAQALVALDAEVEILSANGPRVIGIEELHVLPGNRPDVETSLSPSEIITGFHIPAKDWARRSLYLKIRDRESYEFALASAAVALSLAGETVKDCRIALGGVATVPWRARDAEQVLKGHRIGAQTAVAAADAAFAGAVDHGSNGFKKDLGRRTLTRALLQAAAMEA